VALEPCADNPEDVNGELPVLPNGPWQRGRCLKTRSGQCRGLVVFNGLMVRVALRVAAKQRGPDPYNGYLEGGAEKPPNPDLRAAGSNRQWEAFATYIPVGLTQS